jgi:hypothetical protein
MDISQEQMAADASPFWNKIFDAVRIVDAAIDLALQASTPDTSDKVGRVSSSIIIQESGAARST